MNARPMLPSEPALPYRHILLAALCQLIVLVWTCQQHLYDLNADGIAYLRLAHYLQIGDADLMISGYWGVLLSWLMVPLLNVGVEPLIAAKLVMILSAFVFLGGAMAVFYVFGLSPSKAVVAIWLTVFANIGWTSQLIAPDQLVSGLLCLGTAVACSSKWTQKTAWPMLSGSLFGIAYLAKAVAFPLALMLCVLCGGMQWRILRNTLIAACKASAMTVASFAVVAAPWVMTLSEHYDTFTFSTSGKINHAIFGPKDVDRFHPVFRTYHVPEPGRLTQWERPSVLPYRYWSPLDSVHYFFFQLLRVMKNVAHISLNLLQFDLLGLGFFSLFIVLLVPYPSVRTLAASPWRLALLPAITMAAIYLPVYDKDLRYYYGIYPFLLMAALQLPVALGHLSWFRARQRLLHWSVWLVPVSFVLGGTPAFIKAMQHSVGERATLQAAQYIRARHLQGPVGDVDGKVGLYLAYFIEQPWYGSEVEPSPEDIVKAGIKLLCVATDRPLVARLRDHPAFRRLDADIFPDGAAPYLIFVVQRQ